MDNYDERTISSYNTKPVYGQQNNFQGNAGITYSLIIIDNTRNIRIEELHKEQISIGRSADICISSSIVSRTHGVFTKIRNQYYYEDCGSLNGTLYNNIQVQPTRGQPSQKILLKDGDVLKIDTNTNISESVLIIFSTQPVARSKWQYINLCNLREPLLIGRAVPDNHLQLEGLQISRLHAKIFLRNGRFIIQDANSMNGIIINGRHCNREYTLSEKDVICIGSTKLIFSGGFLVFNKAPNGIKVDVRDISRVVKGNKTILSHVSLTIEPSSLVAIIGGSGAGKSTFMNCINGFEPATSGQVFMNDLDLYQNYNYLKSGIGYVPQKDELHDFLTVKDALTFTANLRLTNDVQSYEIKPRIQQVLKIMDLTEHQNTMIKKLSGGQKKRVSIAMELVSDPDIFFLDEPTSGLDPETETALMKQLKYLSANIGKTIVVITHTLQNIHLFDKIVFLAPGGKLCYYGSPKEATSFFGVETLPEAYEKIKGNIDYFVSKYSNSVREVF